MYQVFIAVVMCCILAACEIVIVEIVESVIVGVSYLLDCW